MRRITAFAAVTAIIIGTAPGAAAEPVADPAPGVEAAADGPTLTLADLGASSTIAFYVKRDGSSTSVTFPVPRGLTPVQLRARIELPINLRFGNLTVTQDGRTINRQLLPAQDQAEVVIPLNGVQMSGGDWVTLNMVMTAVPQDNYCWDDDAPIRLVNGVVAFAGGERPPATVADFLPPVLRKVTIAVPANPSPPESSAAAQLAAAVARRNGQQPEVVVVPLPDGPAALPPPAPYERQFIVREGPDKGLSLQGGPGMPALLISGPGSELTDQVGLLTDDALRYAVSTTAVAESIPEQRLESDSTTVEQLTGGGLSSEAMWPRVGIELDQSRWGHPLAGVTVRLVGSYTPLPDNIGGEVIVSMGNETVDRWPAEDTGAIDRTVTIPDRLLKRFSSLEVAVRTTGETGHCGDYLPILLRIDGGTAITVQQGNPPVPSGFQSLPQALMPRIRIGIGPDAFGDTVRAAQIMVGLQRASGVPLFADVITLQQAIESTDPAVLISADGWNNQAITPPFSVDQGRITINGVNTEGQSVTLDLDPAKGFGSLQTVFDGNRTVLLATSSGAPGQLDELLRYLAGQPGRWPGLDGRAVISVPGMEPITVPTPPAEFAASEQQGASAGTEQQQNWFWWAVGGIAAVAAVGAGAILMRARRK